MHPETHVLAFGDRRRQGRYAVTDASRTPVAWVAVERWWAASFEVRDAGGRLLCLGRQRRFWSRWWDVHDPHGRRVAALQGSLTGRRSAVHLHDGRVAAIHGRWVARDWAMLDAAGQPLMTAIPTTSGWSWWDRDAWAVGIHDPTLSLAEVVGVVSAHRLMVKHART